MSFCVSLADVETARQRLAGKAHVTPVMTCESINALSGGRQLFFKCENLQKIGAFKFRGAYNAVMKLTDEEAAKGVVSHSSGNHAQALALAARMRNIPAYIVMPENSASVKIRAVQGYGAAVHLCSTAIGAREAMVEELRLKTGAMLIPPYDHPEVIAGQGTLALEFLEQAPHLDALVVPVGGGGMLAGVCIAAKGRNPNIRIFAAEPAEAADTALSFAAKERIQLDKPTTTMADGLRTVAPGKLTFPINLAHVEKVVLVSEAQIKAAMRLVWERMKLVIEPSGAVGLAAALTDDFKNTAGVTRVGVVLCGGNVDLDNFSWKD